jgi:hypothetical protein
LIYSNYLTATLTGCEDCDFQFDDEWTPKIHRTDAVVASRSVLGFGGVLRGKFSQQYDIQIGRDAGRCEGIMRRGEKPLAFGVGTYEQKLADSWDDDLDATCYLPELEAGRYNYSIVVDHLAPGVIHQGDEAAGTKTLRGSDHGLGAAVFEIVVAPELRREEK